MTRSDGLFATLALVALAAVLAYLIEPEDRMAGAARVIDGDTIAIGGRTIRLAGIDAPELAQTCTLAGRPSPCGEIARDAVRRITSGAEVQCRITGRDKYRRGLGRCEAAGIDLAAALVRDGLAVAYGGYAAEEQEARRAGRGLWAGSFERPSEWRKAHRPERPR